MRAPITLVWENHSNCLSPRFLLRVFIHCRHIVVIDNRNIANAFLYCFNLGAVIPLGFAGQV